MASPEEQTFSKVRLYVKATMLGFKGGLRTQHCHTSLIKVEGVNDQKAVEYYLGKRIAYIYKVRACAHCLKRRGKGRVRTAKRLWHVLPMESWSVK